MMEQCGESGSQNSIFVPGSSGSEYYKQHSNSSQNKSDCNGSNPYSSKKASPPRKVEEHKQEITDSVGILELSVESVSAKSGSE